MARVYKHPKYPGLSPMSQRGHDLLDLYVQWGVEEQHTQWDAFALAAKTVVYFSLCCRQDFKIHQLYEDCEGLVGDTLLSASVPHNVLSGTLSKLWVQKENELLIDEDYLKLNLTQRDVVNECLLLTLDTENQIQKILYADWIDMTGSTDDTVEIPAGDLGAYLKSAPLDTFHSPEKFKLVLNKVDFMVWRLKSAVEFSEVYSTVTDVVLDKLEGVRAVEEREERMIRESRESEHDA